MKKRIIFKRITLTTFLLTITGMLFFNPLTAMACGYGNSGGSDFVPQRQSGYSSNQPAAVAINSDQAKGIVKNHVGKLNPDLAVGSINDAGGFFEVEVLNETKEVLQLLGVDKYSGRLMLLN
jgi:hypothetical protein